jgi:hypothetical protein
MLLKGNIVEFYLKQKACKAMFTNGVKSAPNSTLFYASYIERSRLGINHD